MPTIRLLELTNFATLSPTKEFLGGLLAAPTPASFFGRCFAFLAASRSGHQPIVVAVCLVGRTGLRANFHLVRGFRLPGSDGRREREAGRLGSSRPPLHTGSWKRLIALDLRSAQVGSTGFKPAKAVLKNTWNGS